MAFGFTKSRLSPIAVDFGADSLKLLQIVPGDTPQLVAAAAAVVPEHARSEISARIAFYGQALKDLLKAVPFRGRRCICSISALQTLACQLEIPRVDGGDIEAQIRMQLQERMNLEASRMVYRSFVVGQTVRNGTNRQQVVAFAAPRPFVMQYIAVANHAKLEVVGMHGEHLAIAKAFEHAFRRATDRERTVCYVDLGAATTKVMVCHGSEMVFAKNIEVGADELNRAAASASGAEFLEARLRRGGASDSLDDAAAAVATMQGGPDDNASVEGARRAQVEAIVDELRLSLRYHQRVFSGRTIEKIVFLGGESRQLETCKAIARAVKLPAQLGDPLARVSRLAAGQATVGVDFDQSQPGWAVPMGLCLSEANL